MEPSRVDLTPFAAVSYGGKAHVISLAVTGANQPFTANGRAVSAIGPSGELAARCGMVARITLAAAPPIVTTGSTKTRVTRDSMISGDLLASRGPVTMTLEQKARFLNDRSFDVSAFIDDQTVARRTDTLTNVITWQAKSTFVDLHAASSPLDLRYRYGIATDGSAAQTTKVRQALESGGDGRTGCIGNHETATDNVVSSVSESKACDHAALLRQLSTASFPN